MKSAIAKGNVLSAVTKTPVATKAILVPQRSTINVYGNTGRAFLLSPIPSASARAALDSRYILLLNGHIESGSHMTEGDRKAIADLAKMVADLSTSIGNTQIDFSNLFEIVNQGQPNEYILAKLSFHSKNDVVAFSNGADGGTVPSIPIATYITAGVVKVDPTTMTVDAAGVIAVKGDLFNLSNYWTKTDSDERYLLKTEKPDLTGYATKIYVDDQISTHTHTLYVKYQTPETPAPQTIYGDIRVIGKIYSSDDIVAFSNGTGGGSAPSIPIATYATVGVVKVDPSTMTVDANGMIAVKGDLFNLSNYYDKSASDGRFSAIAHRHLFSELDGKPTTLGGYGITDGMTASQISAAIAQAKSDIVNSSPAALDTLNELATALGNDPNFATTTATALGNRLRVDISTQGLTDTQRANGRANLGLGNLSAGGAGTLKISTPTGFAEIGSMNDEYFHFVTDRPQLYMNKSLAVNGELRVYATNSYINGNKGAIAGNTIYHQGNINRNDIDFVAKNITAAGNVVSRSYSPNVCQEKFSNTPLGYIIKTPIVSTPTTQGGGMHVVKINGYAYGNALPISLDVVFYQYNGFVDYRVTSGGGWCPKLTISRRNGLVEINVKNGTYFAQMYISYFQGQSNTGNYYSDWSIISVNAESEYSTDGEVVVDYLNDYPVITSKSTQLRGPDGNVKWTAQVSAAGDYLEFYNASGVLEMRLSQAGKVQARGDIEGFSNFS